MQRTTIQYEWNSRFDSKNLSDVKDRRELQRTVSTNLFNRSTKSGFNVKQEGSTTQKINKRQQIFIIRLIFQRWQELSSFREFIYSLFVANSYLLISRSKFDDRKDERVLSSFRAKLGKNKRGKEQTLND